MLSVERTNLEHRIVRSTFGLWIPGRKQLEYTVISAVTNSSTEGSQKEDIFSTKLSCVAIGSGFPFPNLKRGHYKDA